MQGTEAAAGGQQRITALVPSSEILRYAIDLRSIAQRLGTFTAQHDHCQELPSHMVQQVRREQEEDAD